MIQMLRRKIQLSIGVAILWAIVALAGTAFGIDAGTRYYWAMTQPDPRIEAKEDPVPNGNVDANGVSFNQWVEAGGALNDWHPVPKTTFKRGEILWVLRHDCFFNKVDGWVSRPMLGPSNSIAFELQGGPPRKRTQTGQCSRTNFADRIPADAPTGTFTFAPYVTFFKNPTERVNVWFRTVSITIVE